MKCWLLLWSVLLCAPIFHAEAQGVEFRDLTLTQALEQARKENKLVFIDCYTSWCGPCKNMLENVFTLPDAGEFMNTAFVCVKFDMEKGEGIELRKRFHVQSFPTFFIICPDGTIQHRLVGGSKWEYFREQVKRSLKKETSYAYLTECYQKGKITFKQYPLYVQALKDAGETKEVEKICIEAFHGLNDKRRCRKENWFIFDQEMTPTDIRFEYLIRHKVLFDQNLGKCVVDERINSVYAEALVRLNDSKDYNWLEEISCMVAQLKCIDFDGKQKIENLLEYEMAYLCKDIEGILKSCEEHLTDFPPYVLINLAFQSDFIIQAGSNDQLARYIQLGRQAERQAFSPQMARLIEEYMDRYEDELKDRLTYAEIRGKVTREGMDEVGLYKVEDGKEDLIATSKIGQDKQYGFCFHPERVGFYSVGGEKNLDRIRLYIKPGDQGEVNFPEDTIIITSRNTPENLLLANWETLMIPVRERVDHYKYALFDYRDFFPYFMEFLPKAREFQRKISFKNESFAELLRTTIDFDLDYYAFRILNALKAGKDTYKPSRPIPADYPEYYQTIVSKDKLCNTSILEQPYGYDYLQRYTTFALGSDRVKMTLSERLEWLPCDLLKAEIILWYAERCATYEVYMDIIRKYGSYLTTENHRKRMNAISARLYKGEKGMEAADFTYPDKTGKIVSLSDFKGKIVVVDVWATWCGPCRKEIPYLVKLEKEMDGKDVVFIGISVDQQKDYQKWLKVLEQENLGGVQLFAGGWSQVVKDYKIKGIPRFMVFDREGKVVTIDAPRPSSPELKKMLENLLKG